MKILKHYQTYRWWPVPDLAGTIKCSLLQHYIFINSLASTVAGAGHIILAIQTLFSIKISSYPFIIISLININLIIYNNLKTSIYNGRCLAQPHVYAGYMHVMCPAHRPTIIFTMFSWNRPNNHPGHSDALRP